MNKEKIEKAQDYEALEEFYCEDDDEEVLNKEQKLIKEQTEIAEKVLNIIEGEKNGKI